MNRTKIQHQLLERASRDPAFRQALIADPRQLIEREYSITIPASMKLQVVEEQPNSLFMVVPASAGELSDLELESVAGGKDVKDVKLPPPPFGLSLNSTYFRANSD